MLVSKPVEQSWTTNAIISTERERERERERWRETERKKMSFFRQRKNFVRVAFDEV